MIRMLFEQNPRDHTDVDHHPKYQQYEDDVVKYMVKHSHYPHKNIRVWTINHATTYLTEFGNYEITCEDVDGPNIIPRDYFIRKSMRLDPAFMKVNTTVKQVVTNPDGRPSSRVSRVIGKVRGTVKIDLPGRPLVKSEQEFLVVDDWPLFAMIMRKPGLKKAAFDGMKEIHQERSRK